MPATALTYIVDNSVWFFTRGGIHSDKSKLNEFYKWLDFNFNSRFTHRKSLVVYPEGHRNVTYQPLPLKLGMIEYAYYNRQPVQICIAFGLEDLIDDKKLLINDKGGMIYYYYDKPIFTEDYPTMQEYVEEIKRRFTASFDLSLKLIEERGFANPQKVKNIIDNLYRSQYSSSSLVGY